MPKVFEPSRQKQAIDRLISASWVIPIEPFGQVMENASVAIDGDDIVAVLPTLEALERFDAREVERFDGHAIIPGMINTHTHAAMSLLRGVADDMPLMPWLTEKIWPLEGKLLGRDFVYDGTRLACQEMIRGGVTCFNDMYFYGESAAQAVVDSGLRAMIGLIVFDRVSDHSGGPDDCLKVGADLMARFGDQDRLSFCVAPHAPYTVGDQSFEKIAAFKADHGLKMTIHLNETEGEVVESQQRYGLRPVDRLDRLGLIDRDLIAVHAVSLSDADIELLGERRAAVAHCPTSNLKLACGIAPIAALLDKGVTVSLGTDSNASNNRLDLFQEMRLAALLSKAKTGDASVVPAYQALSLATLDGARALGLDETIGSIVAGKKADLVAIDLSRPEYQPCYDPVSHLVYVCGREAVAAVWIAGQKRFSVGNLQHNHDKDLNKTIAVWQNLVLR